MTEKKTSAHETTPEPEPEKTVGTQTSRATIAPPPLAPAALPHVAGTIRVRATAKGFYGNKYREIGDVFDVYSENEVSDVWMERIKGK